MDADLLPTDFEGRLDHVVEECAEVIKAVMKLRRFGNRAKNVKTGVLYDNGGKLHLELLDLEHAVGDVLAYHTKQLLEETEVQCWPKTGPG